VLETTIPLLPFDIKHNASSSQQMLAIEEQNMQEIGVEGTAHYLAHPPSSAVDGDEATAFKSIKGM
jgi:hypothetical protein